MPHLLAEKRSSASLRRRRSESSAASTTPSDGKSAEYKHRSYPAWLTTKGVYMQEPELSISDESKRFCQNLLSTECDLPENTLLRQDVYRRTIAELHDKNEARVVQDVARLFVPSVRSLANLWEPRFTVLVESVNDGWDYCYPLTNLRPQPDYAVGFGRSGLTDRRIRKLEPMIRDDPTFKSIFTPTHYMYFAVLTSEVKCGTMGLDIADRQNANSMGTAINMLTTLFRLAGRESELHNKPIVFSASHDHRCIRLTGWGPNIKGDHFTVHPYSIDSFDVTAKEGLQLFTPYRFSYGVYEYALTLLEKINAIIDDLPSDLNLDRVTPLTMGFNQEPELQQLTHSELSQQHNTQSLLEVEGEVPNSQSSRVNLQQLTPETSQHAENSSKRKKKN